MRGLVTDCRHALRVYVREPGAALIAIFVLALSIAFVGAFLSLYVDLVLRPHPAFERSGRIATVVQRDGANEFGIPYAVVSRLAGELASVETAAMSYSNLMLAGPERLEVFGEFVSEGFFDSLRPRLVMGHGFQREDHAPDAEPVVVLSYRYWQQRFGGDQGVLGTRIEISPHRIWSSLPAEATATFRVVGVMSPYLTGLAAQESALWFPLEPAYPLIVGKPEALAATLGRTYVNRPPRIAASAVATEIGARYDSTGSPLELRAGVRLDAIDGIVRDIDVHRAAKKQMEMFLGGSGLLALVAAANVSLFLLARAPWRRREMAIRLAVGAPVRRIARQLATEACLLVAISAALGLILSVWISSYLRGLALLRDAEWRDVTLLDWRVLCLVVTFLLVLALIVSAAPILTVGHRRIAEASRRVTASAAQGLRLAGTVQLAVSGILGGAALASAWYLVGLTFGDPGYETADRYTVEFVRDLSRSDDIVELSRRRDVIEAIPGVAAVAFGFPVPGEPRLSSMPMLIPDPNRPTTELEVLFGYLEPRLVELLGLDLVEGRVPEVGEAGVVLVNQSLAHLVWGREDVVGERLAMTSGRNAEVIGVLKDFSFVHPSATARPFVFMRTSVQPLTVIRTELTATQLRQALDRSTSQGELELQISNVLSLRNMYNAMIAPDRARGILTIATAVLVVLLTAFGSYGTQRYLVAASRREYAIRASLGAGPQTMTRLIISRGLTLGLPGLAIGGILAFIVVAWLREDYLAGSVSPMLVAVGVVMGLALLLLGTSLGAARRVRTSRLEQLLRED